MSLTALVAYSEACAPPLLARKHFMVHDHQLVRCRDYLPAAQHGANRLPQPCWPTATAAATARASPNGEFINAHNRSEMCVAMTAP
jgi:hypothetical protein